MDERVLAMRAKLKKRVIMFSVLVALSILLLSLHIAGMFGYNIWTQDGTHYEGFRAGFQFGMALSGAVIFTIFLIRDLRALGCEARLVVLYIKENDERRKLIRDKSGFGLFMISMVTLLFATLITGYFSAVAFYTLIAVSMTLEAIACGLRIYYSTKF